MVARIVKAADRVAVWHSAADMWPTGPNNEMEDHSEPSPEASQPPKGAVPNTNKFKTPANGLKKVLENQVDFMPAPKHEHPAVKAWTDSKPDFAKTYFKPEYQDALKTHLGPDNYNKLLHHMPKEHHDALHTHQQAPAPKSNKFTTPANGLKKLLDQPHTETAHVSDWLAKHPGFEKTYMSPKYIDALKGHLGDKAYNELQEHLKAAQQPAQGQQSPGYFNAEDDGTTPPKKPTKKWVGEGPEPGKEPGAHPQGTVDEESLGNALGKQQGLGDKIKQLYADNGKPNYISDEALDAWNNKHSQEKMLKDVLPNLKGNDPQLSNKLQQLFDEHYGDQNEINNIKGQQPQKSFGEAVHETFPDLLSKEKALSYDEKTPEEQQKLLQNTVNGQVENHPELWDGLNKLHNDFFGEDAYNPHPAKEELAQQMAENHGSNYNYDGWIDSLNNDEIKEYKNSPNDAKDAFDQHMSDLGYGDEDYDDPDDHTDEYYDEDSDDEDEDYEDQFEEPHSDDEDDDPPVQFSPQAFADDYKKAFPLTTYNNSSHFGSPEKTKSLLQGIIDEPEDEALGEADNRDHYDNKAEYEEAYDQWMQNKLKAQQLHDKYFGDSTDYQTTGDHAKALQIAKGIQALDPKTFDDNWVKNWADENTTPGQWKETLNNLIQSDWSPEETAGYKALLQKHFGEGGAQSSGLGQKLKAINPHVGAEVWDKWEAEQGPEFVKDKLKAMIDSHGDGATKNQLQQVYDEHFGEGGFDSDAFQEDIKKADPTYWDNKHWSTEYHQGGGPEAAKELLQGLTNLDYSLKPGEKEHYQKLLDKYFGERQPQSLGQKMKAINPAINAEVFDKQSPEGQKDILQNIWAKDPNYGNQFQQLYDDHYGDIDEINGIKQQQDSPQFDVDHPYAPANTAELQQFADTLWPDLSDEEKSDWVDEMVSKGGIKNSDTGKYNSEYWEDYYPSEYNKWKQLKDQQDDPWATHNPWSDPGFQKWFTQDIDSDGYGAFSDPWKYNPQDLYEQYKQDDISPLGGSYAGGENYHPVADTPQPTSQAGGGSPFANAQQQHQSLAQGIKFIFPNTPLNLDSMSVDELKKTLEDFTEHLADTPGHTNNVAKLKALYDQNFGQEAGQQQPKGSSDQGKPSSKQYTGAEPLSVEELTQGLDWGDQKQDIGGGDSSYHSLKDLQQLAKGSEGNKLFNSPGFPAFYKQYIDEGGNPGIVSTLNNYKKYLKDNPDADEINQIKQHIPQGDKSDLKSALIDAGVFTPEEEDHLKYWQDKSPEEQKAAITSLAGGHVHETGDPLTQSGLQAKWQKVKDALYGDDGEPGEIQQPAPKLKKNGVPTIAQLKAWGISPEIAKTISGFSPTKFQAILQDAQKVGDKVTPDWASIVKGMGGGQQQGGGSAPVTKKITPQLVSNMLQDFPGSDWGSEIDNFAGKSPDQLKAYLESLVKNDPKMHHEAQWVLDQLWGGGQDSAQKPGGFDLQPNGVPTAKQLEAWGLNPASAIAVSGQSPELFQDNLNWAKANSPDGGPWSHLHKVLKDHDWPLQGGQQAESSPDLSAEMANIGGLSFLADEFKGKSFAEQMVLLKNKIDTPGQLGTQNKPLAQELYDKYFGGGGNSDSSNKQSLPDATSMAAEIKSVFGGPYLNSITKGKSPEQLKTDIAQLASGKGLGTESITLDDDTHSKWENIYSKFYGDLPQPSGPPEWDPQSFAEQYKEILPGSSSSLASGSASVEKVKSKLEELISGNPGTEKTLQLQELLDHWFPGGETSGTTSQPAQKKPPAAPVGSIHYKALMKQVMDKAPQGAFSEADMKTFRSKKFKDWFDAAPQAYQKTLKTNPGIVIDDFDAGSYSAPVGGGEWEGPSGKNQYYDLMGYPKSKKNYELPQYLQQNDPRSDKVKFPQYEDEQETLPQAEGEHFAPHYGPLPIYRVMNLDLDHQADPSRAPSHLKTDKERKLWAQQQNARLHKIDTILNGDSAGRGHDLQSLKNWGKQYSLTDKEINDVSEMLYGQQGDLFADEKWDHLKDFAQSKGIDPQEMHDLAEKLEVTPSAQLRGNYDHPELGKLILDYLENTKHRSSEGGKNSEGGLGWHWTRAVNKVYKGVPAAGIGKTEMKATNRNLPIAISGLWTGQGEGGTGSPSSGHGGTYDVDNKRELEHNLNSHAPVTVRRLQIRAPGQENQGYGAWHDTIDHGPMSMWTPGRYEEGDEFSGGDYAPGDRVGYKPSLAEELNKTIGGSHEAEVFDKLKPGHKADMLLGKIWKDNPGQRDRIEELYRDFFVGRPDLPTKPHRRRASLQRAAKIPLPKVNDARELYEDLHGTLWGWKEVAKEHGLGKSNDRRKTPQEIEASIIRIMQLEESMS